MGTKNHNTSRALLVVWVLFAFEVRGNLAETCERIDDCSCRKSNGKVINLRKIDGGSTPAFKNIKDSDSEKNYVYSWNPCTKFNEGDGCKGVLMCQGTPGTTYSFPCASNVAKFEVISGITYITYESITYKKYKRSFKIGLKCDESKFPGEVESVKEDYLPLNSTYSANLTSRCACDDGCTQSSTGLSPGSIILIVFFALIFVYIIGGILINKYKLGVESMPEMCPNYQFWAGIPSLIKDGFVFTYSGVRSACTSLCQKCSKDSYASI